MRCRALKWCDEQIAFQASGEWHDHTINKTLIIKFPFHFIWEVPQGNHLTCSHLEMDLD